MPRRPRIALLIEASRAYGRGLLRGIAKYARLHGPWTLFTEERMLVDRVPSWFGAWRGDGILARVGSGELERAIYAKHLPAIDLHGTRKLRMPAVDTDNEVVGRLAAERFLADGYRHFGFCGFGGLSYSTSRRDAFLSELARHGASCITYETTPDPDAGFRDTEQRGLFVEPELSRWLAQLPKPIGIFACNDIRGQQLINLCREIDVPVPEQVAIIGVDNDEVLCELCDPTLTSIELDTQTIGYRAAELLDSLMRGDTVDNALTLLPPARLVQRESSSVPAVDDEQIARALWFIRVHCAEPILVDDIAREVGLSRRVLERRFRSLLDSSPHEELSRMRLERAKTLLIETDLSQAAIGEKCGFLHAEYLTVAFKRDLGVTPSQFRSENKAPPQQG